MIDMNIKNKIGNWQKARNAGLAVPEEFTLVNRLRSSTMEL